MKGGKSTAGFVWRLSAAAVTALLVLPDQAARADEGGISFWIPGFFGSLAATPQQPGWSISTIYYRTAVSAGGTVARAREITIGQIPTNLTASLDARVNATANLGLVAPTYV